MKGCFHRLHCTSIVELHEADEMLTRWAKALDNCAARSWSAGERELIIRYRRNILAHSSTSDIIYPHHPRFTGSMRECALYYIGYWTGRLRELLKRSANGEHSPRAWGLLRIPLETIERPGMPNLHVTKDGNHYALNMV